MLPRETSEICRLCLVKEHVNISIFEDNSEQLYYKISSCLPISIAADDELPKKICSNCFDRVNTLYEFWNQTLHAQKYLLTWLNDENKSESSVEPVDQKSSELPVKKERPFLNVRNFESNGQKNENFSSNGSPDFWCSNEDEDDDFEPYHDDECGSFDAESNQTQSFVSEDSTSSPLQRLQGYAEELSSNSFGNLSRIFEVLNDPKDATIEATGVAAGTPSPVRRAEHALALRYDDEYRRPFSSRDSSAAPQPSQRGAPAAEANADAIYRGFAAPTPSAAPRPNDRSPTTTTWSSFAAAAAGAHDDGDDDRRARTSRRSTFVCARCGTAFRYRKTYETHVRIHDNERPPPPDGEQLFVCDVCEQRFCTRNAYIHHARAHKICSTSVATAAARGCRQKTFAGERATSTRARHRRPQRDDDAAAEGCSSRASSFAGSSSDGREPTARASAAAEGDADRASLRCPVCLKTFAQRKYFVVHRRIHTGERPYKCSTCAKTFTQASALTVHRRYHTGERPYRCEVCSKGFVTRTSMSSHLKYHDGA